MKNCGPLAERDSNRIERIDILHDAVTRRFIVAFRHERAEQTSEANVSLGRYLALTSDKLPSAASKAIAPSEMARNKSGRLNFRCKVSKRPGERGGQ
jgi:hypothetical protein